MKKKLLLLIPAVTLFLSQSVTVFAVTEAALMLDTPAAP